LVRHIAQLHIARIRQDEAELVAARPADDVAHAGAVFDPFTNIHDDCIGNIKTISIVQQAQAVDVDHQIGRRGAIPAAGFQDLVQGLLQAGAVQMPGQIIKERHALQFELALLPAGDDPQQAVETDRLAGAVQLDGAALLDPFEAAI
jgi:hypothetical protein